MLVEMKIFISALNIRDLPIESLLGDLVNIVQLTEVISQKQAETAWLVRP